MDITYTIYLKILQEVFEIKSKYTH